jgi:hypothetical protein
VPSASEATILRDFLPNPMLLSVNLNLKCNYYEEGAVEDIAADDTTMRAEVDLSHVSSIARRLLLLCYKRLAIMSEIFELQ